MIPICRNAVDLGRGTEAKLSADLIGVIMYASYSPLTLVGSPLPSPKETTYDAPLSHVFLWEFGPPRPFSAMTLQ